MTDYRRGGIGATADDAHYARPGRYLQYEDGRIGKLGMEDTM